MVGQGSQGSGSLKHLIPSIWETEVCTCAARLFFSISTIQYPSQRMVPRTVGGSSHVNTINKITPTGMLRVLSAVDPRLFVRLTDSC